MRYRDLVTFEPVESVKQLRAANSAALRGISALTSLRDAIARLGAEELCRVAMATSLGAVATLDGPLATLRRTAWRQALISALACRQIAPLRGIDREEAFACGLLHDFGRVIAIASIESVLADRPSEAPRSESEWMALVDRFHVELGTLTARQWKLAELHAVVIASHHLPSGPGEFRSMLDLVRASDAVVALVERTAFFSVQS